MLVIKVEAVESFDEKTSSFVSATGFTVELEHSLAAISKWESFYEKPFLGTETKTAEEVIKYLECMNLGKPLSEEQLTLLTAKHLPQINAYLEGNHTATWFSDKSQQGGSREIVTSELVYYWMSALTIPYDCDKWNFNRLMTLIKVANVKNAPVKKTGRQSMASQRRSLNAQRLQQRGTTG
jgi:hypothetical protein